MFVIELYKQNFATESEDRVESCRKFCIFAEVYKVRGLVVRNGVHFLFLFIIDVFETIDNAAFIYFFHKQKPELWVTWEGTGRRVLIL